MHGVEVTSFHEKMGLIDYSVNRSVPFVFFLNSLIRKASFLKQNGADLFSVWISPLCL